METSVILGIFTAGVLLLAFFGSMILVTRLLARRPAHDVPLLPAADGHFDAAGKRIQCAHCGGTAFRARQILLNTWLLSLLRIDWLDSSATVLACEQCGRLEWFAQQHSASGGS